MRLNPKIPIQSFECSSPSVGVKDGCLLSRHWRRRAAVVSLDSAHYNGDRWWHFHCGKNIYKHLSSCSHIAINSAVRLSVRRVPDTHCCAWIWPKMWLVLDIWASWKRHLAIILVFCFFSCFLSKRSTGASPALGSFCGREEQSGEPHDSFTPQQCGDGHLLLVVWQQNRGESYFLISQQCSLLTKWPDRFTVHLCVSLVSFSLSWPWTERCPSLSQRREVTLSASRRQWETLSFRIKWLWQFTVNLIYTFLFYSRCNPCRHLTFSQFNS